MYQQQFWFKREQYEPGDSRKPSQSVFRNGVSAFLGGSGDPRILQDMDGRVREMN